MVATVIRSIHSQTCCSPAFPTHTWTKPGLCQSYEDACVGAGTRGQQTHNTTDFVASSQPVGLHQSHTPALMRPMAFTGRDPCPTETRRHARPRAQEHKCVTLLVCCFLQSYFKFDRAETKAKHTKQTYVHVVPVWSPKFGNALFCFPSQS